MTLKESYTFSDFTDLIFIIVLHSNVILSYFSIPGLEISQINSTDEWILHQIHGSGAFLFQ